MSETNPIDENDLPEGINDAINADPNQPEERELEGGGTDDEIERQGQRDVEENIEAELDDRLQSHGEDRL